MFAHSVFFTLHDKSEAAVQQLVSDCYRDLASIPGLVFFAAGTCSAMARPVNDRQYEVALHTFFSSQAEMEAYLAHPQHLEFVVRHKPNWAQLRVFDADVAAADESRS